MLYHGRGQLDTITQAEIIAPHTAISEDLGLFAAGETMLEAVDKVAEDHERNVRLVVLLLLTGLRALETAKPADPAAVAESFMLKLLSLSGLHPSPDGLRRVRRSRSSVVLGRHGRGRLPELRRGGRGASLARRPGRILQTLAIADMAETGTIPTPDVRVRKESRGLLYGFAEYHLERRILSLPMLARTALCSSSPARHRPRARAGARGDRHGRQWLMGHPARPAANRGPRCGGGGARRYRRGRCRGRPQVAHGLRVLHRELAPTGGRGVLYLMNFNRKLLRRRRDRFHELNVRIRFTGRRDWRVPRSVLREIEAAEEMTRDNTGMTLTIAFNYGGRVEIVDAVKQIVRDHDAGKLRTENIMVDTIHDRLYYPDMPDPDCRTPDQRGAADLQLPAVGGGLRGALVHLGPWPDFDREHLYEAIRDFQKRSRRFGNIEDD